MQLNKVFQRIKKGEESFFRDDELEVEEEAQKMNEGGEVEDREAEVRAFRKWYCRVRWHRSQYLLALSLKIMSIPQNQIYK